MKVFILLLMSSLTLAFTPIEKEAFANIVTKKEADLRKLHSDNVILEKKLKTTELNLKEILQKYQEVISTNRKLSQDVMELKKNNKFLWDQIEKNGTLSDDLVKLKKEKKSSPSRLPASIEVKK